MLADHSAGDLRLPIISIEPGWIQGHRAVQAEVKSSFPLIVHLGILKSIIHLFLVFLLFFPSQSKHKELPHKVLTDVTN